MRRRDFLLKRALLTLTAAACLAQAPTAALTGSLFDELGGPVIAAKLQMRGTTGHLYVSRTTEQGIFRFLRLDPGQYTLGIEQPGLCMMEVPGIALAAGQEKALPRLTMKVAPEGQNCP